METSYADTGLTRPVLIDRRVTQAQLSPSYDDVTERTTFTLPYETEEVEIVTKDGQRLPWSITPATPSR